MSDPSGGDPFADVPLFREIQKLLTSSSGPVNWELARQVAVASAVAEPSTPALANPSTDDRSGLEDAVRLAELQISGFTGLASPAEMATVKAVGRAEWVTDCLAGLQRLAEPAAERVAEGFIAMQPEPDADAGAGANPFAATLGQVVPLLLGMQAGAVFGSLASQALGRYDVAVPHPSAETLVFVVPNVAAFERDWSLPPMEFRQWLALREVTYRYAFSRPWVRTHLEGLIGDFTSTLEVDVAGLQEQLQHLDPTGGPDAIQDLLGAGEGPFGRDLDPEQRIKLARIQALVAASIGYGDHVASELGATLLSNAGLIGEAMRRHREEEQSDPIFERLFGIEVGRDHVAKGKTFCTVVAEQTSETVLARMWDSAEALPSMPELDEPLLWMSRMA